MSRLFPKRIGKRPFSPLEAAIAQANAMSFGNLVTNFTSDRQSARGFREPVEAGIVGVNVGVAQPVAVFPFSDWKESFFGDLRPHVVDGIAFHASKEVVGTHW